MDNSPLQSTQQRGYHPYRGRGRGRGNRGIRYNGPPRQNRTGGYDHGDMRAGLFKPSFLEDPWKDLISKRRGMGSFLTAGNTSAVDTMDIEEGNEESGPQVNVEEGEILLPEDDEDDE